MKEYCQTPDEVIIEQRSSINGLTSKSVIERLKDYDKNRICIDEEKEYQSLFSGIYKQLKNPLILIMAACAIMCAMASDYAAAGIIFAAAMLNIILGNSQKTKYSNLSKTLLKLQPPYAKVKRDGEIHQISTETIVPGDIVLLETDDIAPADIRLIESTDLIIEEFFSNNQFSKKDSSIVFERTDEIPLKNRKNMCCMGGRVISGNCMGIVCATGMDTELGKLIHLIFKTQNNKSPLSQKLLKLNKRLALGSLAYCFIILFSWLLSGNTWHSHATWSLLAAAGLSVIPEGLIAAVSSLLKAGARLIRHNISIPCLDTVETLGYTQIICFGDTGVITQNKFEVSEHFGDEAMLSGALYLCGMRLENSDSLVETALEEYARKCGQENIYENLPYLGNIPSSSGKRIVSTFHKSAENSIRQFARGDTEDVLSLCNSVFIGGGVKPLNPILRKKIHEEYQRISKKSLHLLAVACKEYSEAPNSPDDLEKDLIFIGFAGITDPIKPDIKSAVITHRRKNIRHIIISGGEKKNALITASSLGILLDESQSITGYELDDLTDAELSERLGIISVYTCLRPEQKVRVISAFKKKGKIIAIIGNGVEDIPAVKAADIGIDMPGSEYVRDVSDISVKDISDILSSIEAGKHVNRGIRRTLRFLLTFNFAEIAALLIASITGNRIFMPIHIILINMLLILYPAITIGTEDSQDDISRPRENIFSGGIAIGAICHGSIMALLALASFFIGNTGTLNASEFTPSTMALATMSACMVFHLFNTSTQAWSMRKHGYMLFLSIILTSAIIYIPGLNTFLSLDTPPIRNLIIAIGISTLIVPLVKLADFIWKKYFSPF